MTKTTGSRNDLAADLLAEGVRPLAPEPVAPPRARVTSARPKAPDKRVRSGRRRPTLSGAMRLSPLTWQRPSAQFTRQRSVVRVGPFYGELSWSG